MPQFVRTNSRIMGLDLFLFKKKVVTWNSLMFFLFTHQMLSLWLPRLWKYLFFYMITDFFVILWIKMATKLYHYPLYFYFLNPFVQVPKEGNSGLFLRQIKLCNILLFQSTFQNKEYLQREKTLSTIAVIY